MKIAFSELCLVGGGVEQNVDCLIEAGADQVELLLDGKGWNDFHLHMEPLVTMLQARSVDYAVHTPVWDINLTAENSHVRQAALETYHQSIIFAHKLGAHHVILHPGFCNASTFNKETARRRSREALLTLLEYNKDYGVQLLVENVGNTASSIFTEEEFIHFLDDMPNEVGYIVDLGHALITGWNIPRVLKQLGKRLYALHIHDNDGTKDSHLPIGRGIMDWDTVFKAIETNVQNVSCILEYNIGIPLEELTRGKELLQKALGKDS